MALATMPNHVIARDRPPETCFSTSDYASFAQSDLLQRLARGVNLPNWDTADTRYRPAPEALNYLFQEGFTHIRLPVFHPNFTNSDFTSTGVAEYIQDLLAEVRRLNEIGYVVTLDLHPNGEFNQLYWSQPDLGYQRLEAIWTYLASVLVTETNADDVLVEFLNEPDTKPDIWDEHIKKLARHIRQLLPDHTFVVGPHGPMRHESLAGFEPLQDSNTVYAIHFYDPFIFTHQGAEWLPSDDPVRASVNVPFPSRKDDERIANLVKDLEFQGRFAAAGKVREIFEEPWTEKDVQRAFEMVQRWSKKHGVPVFVNEFGALSYHAPRQDRLHWLGTVVKEAEAKCLGWTHWDFSDGFGIVDPDTGKADSKALDMLLNRKG